MKLTGFELKKIFSPVVVISIAVLFGLNIMSLFFGEQDGCYCAGQPPYETNIDMLKENGDFFAGEINDTWYQLHIQEEQDIINAPENQVSDEEKNKIREELMTSHYSDKEIDEMGSFIYLKEEIRSSNEYNKFEDMEFSAKFYEKAKKTGNMLAYEYKQSYPGKKGEILAAKTYEMYNDLSENYTAYYYYDWGWWKLRNLHFNYPFSVGLIIAIGLSSIFSMEYSRKTDALILSSKNGKGKLISAKVKAGLIFSTAVWAVTEAVNSLIIAAVYGTEGAKAHWQNFLIDFSPFKFDQLQVTLVTLATSFLGVIFLAGVVMFVSAVCKNRFVSLIISSFILLFPCFDFAFTDIETVQKIYDYLPAKIITGICEWQKFDLIYIFGKAVPFQYAVIAFALTVTAVSIYFCYFVFRRKQVEN